nr:S26 family signal peptidase [Hephaestia sp. MAHUQ-44]
MFAHADCLARAGAPPRGTGRYRARYCLACAVGAAGLVLILVTVVAPSPPRLVWNASASAPRGLYAVQAGAALHRGDMVIARMPERVRSLAAERRYLPSDVPLVKRVAALSGDRVCAVGDRISVDRRVIARRLARDAAGRTMPWWRGCGTLRGGAILLLNPAPASFDGRYFGPTQVSDVIGKAVPLWVR